MAFYDPKKIVEEAYDHIAEWYVNWVGCQHSPREHYTMKVLENAQATPRILELGCGPGVPVMRMLLDRGARVVANDISTKQLDLAKARCPQATLIPGDMMALDFEPASFDGIVSFHTLFHLPRTEQRSMLIRIASWMKPGAMFVFSLATVDEEEIYGECLGQGMFWSSYSIEDSKHMMKDTGLDVIEVEVLESGDGQLEEDDPDYGAKFMWIAARKAEP